MWSARVYRDSSSGPTDARSHVLGETNLSIADQKRKKKKWATIAR